MAQCPVLAPEWDDPNGVPISAIFFGGRRRETIPLIAESRDWQHGIFMGATLSSEKTAAASGGLGQVRRDPMAMLPFIGYNVGDYFQHWIDVGKGADADKLPRIFYVNWFRKDAEGKFLWPGFGENSRVLEWVFRRCEDKADAVETPIGLLPTEGAIDTEGLNIDEDAMRELLSVDEELVRQQLPQIREHLASFGGKLPARVSAQLEALESRLG